MVAASELDECRLARSIPRPMIEVASISVDASHQGGWRLA
jgi:hypothetical protein